ncbi:MAG TPA: LamG-like jellyroll fold domain-containing protein [Bacteroidales bacterium]
MNRLSAFCILIFGTITSSSFTAHAQALLPHGFVTYSKGEAYNRVVCRAEIAPGMTFEQIHATEQQVCEKGPFGGDITTQISFDGKWVAFARSLKGTSDGSGGNDYDDFDKWDIYIARVDGKLPVTPIRVGHGYFPSWGDDSRNAVKTLYYAVIGKQPKICKVTINDKGEIGKEELVGNLPADGFEGFAFAAPNGSFAAYRKNSGVYTYYFSGPLKGKDIFLTGGCHPHVTANSQWVYHANRHAVRADGSARGEAGAGGEYHYGSSNDMNWFVTRTEGDNMIINKGLESWLCTLVATDTRFDTERAVKISNEAGFIDIHVYDDKASRKAAKVNRAQHDQFFGKGIRVSSVNKESFKGIDKNRLAKLPVSGQGESFIWLNDKADNRIINNKGEFLHSCRLVPQGLAHVGKGGRMVTSGGYFECPDKEFSPIFTALAKSENQWSAELEFVSNSVERTGPMRIATLSEGANARNWSIGQEDKQLILSLRTTNTGVNGRNPEMILGEIKAGVPYHLVISYTPGLVICSLNGVLRQGTNVTGDISNWSDFKLLFGNEFNADRTWKGEIRNVRLYAYALSPQEHMNHYKQASKYLKELTPEEPITVNAELVQSSTIPSVKQITEQGYSRCVAARHFLIKEQPGGKKIKNEDIIVKEWVILGGQMLNSREKGKTYTLQLFNAKDHPELENEYTADDLPVSDIPVYYNSQLN